MITAVKKIASYILPIKLIEAKSIYSGSVKLLLYKGEMMLCSRNATYSHGLHYTPFLKSFEWLHQQAHLKPLQYLSLGGGVAASSYLLFQKYNLLPQTTIVEIEPIFKAWSAKFLPMPLWKKIKWVTSDVQEFLNGDNGQYDMISIDIFIDLEMPEFAVSSDFFVKVSDHLFDSGIVIMNIYQRDAFLAQNSIALFFHHFERMEVIQNGDNYFLIGRKIFSS